MSKKSKAQKKQSNIKQFFRDEWKPIVGVLLLTFLAYANTLQNDWAYDDWFQVARNAQVTSLSNIPKTFTQSVWQFLDESSRQPAGLYYRPIFNSFLILQYQLFGQKVWAWHLVSVLLHLIVLFLVYALARVWKLDKTVAFIAALIFGLHPVHTEAVAWISSSPDLIASIFVLASLLLYEKSRNAHIQTRLSDSPRIAKSKDDEKNDLFIPRPSSFIPRKSWLCASLGFALLAMFTKEQSVMLLPFIAARELFDKNETLKTRLTQAVVRALPFVIPIALYFAARYYVLGFILRTHWSDVEGITFKQMLLTIPSVTLTYARMIFVPYPLMIMYDHPIDNSTGDTIFLFPLIILILIFAAAIWLIRHSPIGWRAFFFLLFFLLPVLNIRFFNGAESFVHDRYLYLPSIGFCLLAAMGLTKLFQQKKNLLIGSIATIAILFLVLTFFQNRTWRDDFVLFNHALKFTTKKPFLSNALANSHSEVNQYGEAEKFYRKTIEIDPKYAPAYSGLGFVLTKMQRHEEAVQAYEKAAELSPPLAVTYFNLGGAYINLKKYDEAEKALLKAIEIYPQYAPAHYNLGWLYKQRGQNDLAKKHYEITYTLQSQNPSTNQQR